MQGKLLTQSLEGPLSPLSNHSFSLLTPLMCPLPSSHSADHQEHRSTWSKASAINLSSPPPRIPEKRPLLYPQGYSQSNILSLTFDGGNSQQHRITIERSWKFILSGSEDKCWIKCDITIFLFNLILYYKEITCTSHPKISFLLICL